MSRVSLKQEAITSPEAKWKLRLERTLKRYKDARSLCKILVPFWFVAVLACYLPALLLPRLVVVLIAGGSMIFGLQACGWFVNAKYDLRNLMDEFARREDTETLAAALDCWKVFDGDIQLRRTMAEHIEKWLGQMSLEEQRALLAQHREAFSSILDEPYTNVELTIAILKMLEQAGGPADIDRVQALASNEGITTKMQRVRSAARECLKYLSVNANKQMQAQTLLRAANENKTPSGTLLRAAAPTASTMPQGEMLRPSELHH